MQRIKQQETEGCSYDESYCKKMFRKERDEIVNAVYACFYNQVGRSAIRAILFVVWASVIYAVYILASSGWLKPGG